jgi:uncharacterized protein (DUF302 family)
MDRSRYGLRVALPVPFDTALARTTAALAAQGFGVIMSIDMAATLKEKLGTDMGRYTILGACNPALAARALAAEPEVGLLLPCNVIVYETGPEASVVAAMSPAAALGLVGDDAELRGVAGEAESRLAAAVASLERG